MSVRFETFSSGVLVVAAVAIAGAVVHREFAARPAAGGVARSSVAPEYLASWKELLSGGVLVGDSAAPVKIIEFADLECPACKTFHSTVRAITHKAPQDVALIFVHFPLAQHRFARPAARAVECANEQGKFLTYYDLLYDKQDSLGLKAWTSFAVEAGVPDTVRFARCTSATTEVRRVETGRALGAKIGVHATPTVIVNGWRYSYPPTESELSRAILTLKAGKPLASLSK